MRIVTPQRKRWISQVLVCGLLSPWLSALAGDDFGANWQPKPLVDQNAPAAVKAQPQVAAVPSAAPASPELEARLKPAEPFIKEIETRLTLTPKPGVSLVQRLNTLQTVLFGAQQYQDAGQLITKLSEIFPQEAQKAQAEMDRQYQAALQANGANPNALPSTAKASSSGKGKNLPAAPAMAGQPYSPAQTASAATQPQPAIKKKRHGFWNTDDFDSDFDNDPFFQDSFRGRVKTSSMQAGPTYSSGTNGVQSYATQSGAQQQSIQQPYGGQAATQQSNAGPSRLASVAQGLAGLALAVGGLAGAYYLNNKMGSHNNYGAYGNGYGSPYGYSPYGAGVYPYANGVSPYGAGVYPYGTGMTSTVNALPYRVTPYVQPGYGAVPYGAYGQTYNYLPYGVGSVGSGFGSFGASTSAFGGGMGSLGLPGF